MKNNYWDCKDLNEDIKDFHEKTLEEYKVPQWLKICPYCKKELPLRSIRDITLKFNCRNIGDLAVSFCCTECNMGDTVYFREQFNSMKDAIPFLLNKQQPSTQPVLEEEMYHSLYNNLMEQMFPNNKEIKMAIKKTGTTSTKLSIQVVYVCPKCNMEEVVSRECGSEKENNEIKCPNCEEPMKKKT